MPAGIEERCLRDAPASCGLRGRGASGQGLGGESVLGQPFGWGPLRDALGLPGGSSTHLQRAAQEGDAPGAWIMHPLAP